MTVETINDLFIHALSDVMSAEKQLSKALPRLARAATNPELQAAFEKHLDETLGQIDRIEKIVESGDIKLMRMKCAAMEGLVDEAREIIDEVRKGPVLDAALIAAAQKVEHYEIASYGTLCALAEHLDYSNAGKLLAQTLEEEKATDKKLTLLAQQKVNVFAEEASS